MNNERYENVKKYMCKWLPEEALSGCRVRQKGIEPDDVGCLVCVADTIEAQCNGLWATILFLGAGDGVLAAKLVELKAAFDNLRLVFWQVARKLKPEFQEHEREVYANIVEEQLERTKNE